MYKIFFVYLIFSVSLQKLTIQTKVKESNNENIQPSLPETQELLITSSNKDNSDGDFESENSEEKDDNISEKQNLNQRTENTNTAPPWNYYKSGSLFIIPYVVSASVGDKGKYAIEAASAELEKKTCIKLELRKNEEKYLNFSNTEIVNYLKLGANNNIQTVEYSNGCWYKGNVIHIIMQLLGFMSEQNRPDRDKYVKVIEENIIEDYRYLFEKKLNEEYKTTFKYDTKSIMHANAYLYTKNGNPTIIDKRTGKSVVTQNKSLSNTDVKKINKLYNCEESRNVCFDENRNCPYWAKTNKCKRNQKYMERVCCFSCGYNNITISSVTKKHKTKCSDKSSHCRIWAKQGLCNENYKYFMQKTCCISCYKFYKKPRKWTQPKNCLDLKEKCPFWAKHGICSRNQAYMSRKCCLSCKNNTTTYLYTTSTLPTTSITSVETSSMSKTTTTSDNCQDKRRLCFSWSKQAFIPSKKSNRSPKSLKKK